MKVATWNIGGCFISPNKDANFDTEDITYFIKELERVKPEIICLQEAHISKGNNQPEIIAKALDLNYVETKAIANSHIKDGEQLAIAIISTYPILSAKFHQLENPKLEMIWNGKKVLSHDKGLLEIKIDYRGKVIRVLSAHMVPFHKFEKNFLDTQFRDIREHIDRIISENDKPTVMGADMNFEEVAKLIPKALNQGYYFSLDGMPTTPKGKQFDKIIVSREWTTVKSEVISGRADHYLCFAEIGIQNLKESF